MLDDGNFTGKCLSNDSSYIKEDGEFKHQNGQKNFPSSS